MNRVLVVGATGQLGRAATKKLIDRAVAVRALVRTAEARAQFQRLGAESMLGDLGDHQSLRHACAGVAAVVVTANAAVPTRRSDTFPAVERDGNRALIQAAVAAGVRRLVFISAPATPYDRLSPFLQFKRETERVLGDSGLDHVIFRADLFMDTSFAMMGSDIPLRGAESATVLRPFDFAARHFGRIRDNIEKNHVAIIPGDGTSRHAFICIDDMAEFVVSAVHSRCSGTYAIGGPEALTFLDVVRIYERILGFALRVKCAPAAVFRAMATLLKLWTPAGANLMCLNYIAAAHSTEPNPAAAREFGVELTSAEAFLQAKIALAASG